MHVIMKKPVLTKKFNYRTLISLGAILICTMAFAGCSPTSNKDTNHHITKTEHVKKHKDVKKTTASSSSSSSLSSSSSKASSSSSVTTAATSSSQPAVTHTTTSTSQPAAVQSSKPAVTHTTTPASQQAAVQPSKPAARHSTPVAPSTKPATNTTTTRAPAQTTSGFNVNGHHFDIGSFSGTGLVPTDKVYQWSSLRGWYLIDVNSVAARYTSSLGVGSPVTVNGRTYHVTHVLYNRPNSSDTFDTVESMLGSNAIGWQTCNSHGRISKSEGYLSNLNLWFAN